MKKKLPKMIIIEGRRWFQKTYGNTYHSVSVTIDGVTTRSGRHYGYGDQYLQTAVECLLKDYFKDYAAFCQDRRDNPKRYYVTCYDVARERDL